MRVFIKKEGKLYPGMIFTLALFFVLFVHLIDKGEYFSDGLVQFDWNFLS